MACFVEDVAFDLNVKRYLRVEHIRTIAGNTPGRRENRDQKTWCVDRESCLV